MEIQRLCESISQYAQLYVNEDFIPARKLLEKIIRELCDQLLIIVAAFFEDDE